MRISVENHDAPFMARGVLCAYRREGTSGFGPEELLAKVKVCLVGANLGCKTNLVRKHVQDEFDDRYITILGTKVTKREIKLRTSFPGTPVNVNVEMLIWDIMGEKGFRDMLKEAYFYGANGILAVTDLTRRRTLDDLVDWINGVQGVTGPIPVAVIGANHDRKDQLQVSEEEVTHAAQALDAPCFFASERSGEGVEAAFRYLADAVLRSMTITRHDPSHP